MTIKTITCHDVYNYGASLQAYALQTYLSKQGHDVEIIDYKPEYMKSVYDKFWITPSNKSFNSIFGKSLILKFIYSLYRQIKIRKTYKRKEAFDCFKNKKLKCTTNYPTKTNKRRITGL